MTRKGATEIARGRPCGSKKSPRWPWRRVSRARTLGLKGSKRLPPHTIMVGLDATLVKTSGVVSRIQFPPPPPRILPSRSKRHQRIPRFVMQHSRFILIIHGFKMARASISSWRMVRASRGSTASGETSCRSTLPRISGSPPGGAPDLHVFGLVPAVTGEHHVTRPGGRADGDIVFLCSARDLVCFALPSTI